MTDAPIGIFDSGVGGLTVARAIRDHLPAESLVYIGDTAHSPYGPKPIADVRKFSLEVMDVLVDQGVKMLVIACNTASSAVLRDARERYAIPVIEVIQPAVRRAVSVTKTGRIGVIGTVGTIASRAYDDAFAAAVGVELFSQACPRFVEFVESGRTSGDEIMRIATDYLRPLREARVDTLVLGCTHYPFLAGVISYVMGESVTLVSSDRETARDVYRALITTGSAREETTPPTVRYEATSSDSDHFIRLAQRFLGPAISHVDVVNTGVIELPPTFVNDQPERTS